MSLRNTYLQSLLHETEDRLRQTGLQLEELREGIDKAVIVSISNPRGEIKHVNRLMTKISGYSPEQLTGNTYRIFNSAYHPPGFFKRLWQTLNRGEVWKGEMRNKARNGEFFWVDATIVPFFDEDREIYQFMSVWRDITQQKLIAERSELERASREYAGRLASVGQFTSDIVQEIRNPLSAILLRAQMIQRHAGVPEADRASLSNIENLVSRIERVIDGVSLLARDASEDPVIDIDLSKVIHNTTELLHEKLQAMDIRIEIECESQNFMIRARTIQVSQVLLNLINNSLDAVRTESDKWIRILAVRSGDEVHVRISDSGPGIPAELRGKIMQPYFSTKPVGEGTGLGLSISKQILLAHGGRLFLDPDASNTTFVIALPTKPA